MSLVNWLPLHIRNVDFGYEENPLFKNFRLDITERGFYRITSSNHINASLFLLRFLAGITRPQTGEFYAGEVCLSEMSFEEFQPWAQVMGYGFDTGGLLSNKTVQENLMLPLLYHQKASYEDCRERVHEMIAKYDLGPSKDKRPADIPSSDYKMTVLVRAIIHNPKILLLAAPEEGLEKDRFLKFVAEVIKSMNKGSLEAVLYTSQTQFNFSDNRQFEIHLESQMAHVGAVA